MCARRELAAQSVRMHEIIAMQRPGRCSAIGARTKSVAWSSAAHRDCAALRAKSSAAFRLWPFPARLL